jgi:hypothetical protein
MASTLPRGLLTAALALAGLGCTSSPHGALVIELAPRLEDGCTPRAIPAEWECLRVQICESPPLGGSLPNPDAGTRDAGARDAGATTSDPCVQIILPGGDYESATNELIVGRRDLVSFDARVDPDRLYDVEVIAYAEGGGAVAVGRAPYVRPMEENIRIRLQRFGFGSCPGPGDGATIAHSAFNNAVPLPNGDILFLGGATGTNVQAAELIATARFQSVAQVYDVSSGRFRSVTLPDPGFLRVLFEARHIETLADGRERIRVFGGFGADTEDTVSVRLDDKLGVLPFGTPILPGGGTSPQATTDLLYDPETREATVALVMGPTITSVGGAGVSEVVNGRVVSIGGIPSPMTDPTMPSATPFSNAVQVWSATALTSNTALETVSPGGRIGATVTYLSGSSFLAWGGGIVPTPTTVPTGMEHLAAAGLLIDVTPTSASASLVAAPMDTLPVAYHTATRLGPDRVLIVGGASIASTVNTTTPVIALTPPDSFSILSRTGASVTRTAVGGDTREPTIFHTATVLSEVAGVPTAILVVGGAVTRGTSIRTTFRSIDSVGVLRGSGASWTYTELSPLAFPRFGHTATLIPGIGVLVAGGYARSLEGDEMLQPVGQAEMLLLDDLLGLDLPQPVACDGSLPDAPRRVDAGAPDAPEEVDAPEEIDAP